jgi:hypothetical protein
LHERQANHEAARKDIDTALGAFVRAREIAPMNRALKNLKKRMEATCKRRQRWLAEAGEEPR